jgi:hypothetical protein
VPRVVRFSQLGFNAAETGKTVGMKPKTMFYTAVGFATYKIGKRFAKRKARRALSGSSSDKSA